MVSGTYKDTLEDDALVVAGSEESQLSLRATKVGTGNSFRC